MIETLFDHKDYEKPLETPLTEAEATYALREAFYRIYKKYPSINTLAILFAQTALETGRWKSIHNYNFGHLKRSFIPANEGMKFTMFATGENLWNPLLKKTEYKWFTPPHYQTAFRSYKTAVDGAEDYIRLVSQRQRYIKAWQAVLKGDAKAYSYALYDAGYYTANPDNYTKAVVSITDEFKNKATELLKYSPEKPVTTKEEDPKIYEQRLKNIVTESINNSIYEYFQRNRSEDFNQEKLTPIELTWWQKLRLKVGL